jgi:hypothetical protein
LLQEEKARREGVDMDCSDDEDDALQPFDNKKFKCSWKREMKESHPIDVRKAKGLGKEPPRLSKHADASNMTMDQIFDCSSWPRKYQEDVIVPTMNDQLHEMKVRPTSMGELKALEGIWNVIALHPTCEVPDFWSEKPRSVVWNPPNLTPIMSRKRHVRLMKVLRIAKPSLAPAYKDPMWELRTFQGAWNDNMAGEFYPSWLSCGDESMSQTIDPCNCPGWVVLDRKPRPKGNEYSTTADALCHVLFHAEIGIMRHGGFSSS